MEDSAGDFSCSELVEFEAVKSSVASDFEQCYLALGNKFTISRERRMIYNTGNRRLDFR
jgi:hypothetical protein